MQRVKGPIHGQKAAAEKMHNSDYTSPQDDDTKCLTLSPLQYNALSTSIASLLDALGIAGLNTTKTKKQQQAPITHAQQVPQTQLQSPPLPVPTTTSSFSSLLTRTNPKSCVELATTSPLVLPAPPLPPSTSTSTNPPRPWTPEPAVHNHDKTTNPWTRAELARAKQLIDARRKCNATLIETSSHLVEIEQELSLIQQRGRGQGTGQGQKQGQRQGQDGGSGGGGNWTRKQQQPSTSNSTMGACPPVSAARAGSSGDRATNIPSFLSPFLPAPSPPPSPPSDPPGVKRCAVGRPVGKVLRPKDRYYHLGRCDKHHDMSVFETNMQVQRGMEGEYRMREHAWKCSGEGTRRVTMQRL